MNVLDAALAYAAERDWPVFPCQWRGPQRKHPLTEHGHKDATTDPLRIRRWWRQWPEALIGTPTGYGFYVLDIDPRHGGWETIAALGFTELPMTPTTVTGSGGRHLYFAPPDEPFGNTAGRFGRGIGAGLDWRGVGGYVILPAPGSGYSWLPETLSAPFAPIPAALMPKPGADGPIGTPGVCTELSPYGEAALRSAAEKILTAPNGEQEATLNGEAYSIGRLAGAGGVPVELAVEVLLAAGLGMPSHRRGWPWRPAEVTEKIRRSFLAGLAKPRPDLFEIGLATLRDWGVVATDEEMAEIEAQMEAGR